MAEREPTNLAESLNQLTPKTKAPSSARILNAWITQAQDRLAASGPRLSWLVAATVVSAALQRAVDEHGSPLFLLKGGTLLQYRLPAMSRSTRDIDGLVRGGIDDFLAELDKVLVAPWGPLALVRGDVETIEVPSRIVKPRRFDIVVQLNGVTWRRVQVEVSPDEGQAGAAPESIRAPSLAGFGLPSPEHLTSLSMAYQIAQKVHACTDPHNPPALVNDRARDVVDLLLLRDLTSETMSPTLVEVRAAIEDIFATRASEARRVGATPRTWPSRCIAHPHWVPSFASAADSASLSVSLVDAVEELNDWLDLIERA